MTTQLSEFLLILVLGAILMLLSAVLASGISGKFIEIPKAPRVFSWMFGIMSLAFLIFAVCTKWYAGGGGHVVKVGKESFVLNSEHTAYEGAIPSRSDKAYVFTKHVPLSGFHTAPDIAVAL